MGQLITINDQNYEAFIDHVGDDGQQRKRGLIPRDYKKNPVGSYAAAQEEFPDSLLIPEGDYGDWIAEQEKMQSSLQHIRDKGNDGKPIPPKDQDGVGYCWIHSGTMAMELVRALNNEPFVQLAAFMAGCLIKGYRDEGGNGIEGPEFFAVNGICTEQFWPEKSMKRSNDTPEMRKNAAMHKCLRWWDTSDNSAKRKRQVISASLRSWPVIADFNWWGHSVLLIRVLSIMKSRILNSWGQWGDNGIGDLENGKAWPDNACIPCVESASTV